jgi:hypothetical protein
MTQRIGFEAESCARAGRPIIAAPAANRLRLANFIPSLPFPRQYHKQ